MREILFRGKSTDTGAWVHGYYCGPFGDFDEHEICDIADPTCSRVDVDPETVGQYTGLTDKNGKRIFEGDIVKTDEGHIYDVDMDTGRRGWWPFACGDSCGCCEKDTVSPSSCEVIGNKHDNPELLKEMKYA